MGAPTVAGGATGVSDEGQMTEDIRWELQQVAPSYISAFRSTNWCHFKSKQNDIMHMR